MFLFINIRLRKSDTDTVRWTQIFFYEEEKNNRGKILLFIDTDDLLALLSRIFQDRPPELYFKREKRVN